MKNRFKTAGRILLIVALLLTAFSGLPFGSAEAASYKIHHETLDGNDYYYVYQNSSELDETLGCLLFKEYGKRRENHIFPFL